MRFVENLRPRPSDCQPKPRLRLVREAVLLCCALMLLLGGIPPKPANAARRGPRFPNILLISVDTLRTDRLSSYGYSRQTTPEIDALLARGVRFTQARTVEPLTSPALSSMLTSRFPHEHGSTRNGLRVRPGLDSLPKELAGRGYRTAGFIGNWTLRNELSGLGEHFETYTEVFSRKRWFGLFNDEANGEDLTTDTLDWIRETDDGAERNPWFVWIHYVEPHAPYRYWEEVGDRLGINAERGVTKSDRYDTEVGFVDRAVGHLLRGVFEEYRPEEVLVVFASDHGESLGEHGYWGHGRHLYANGVHVPMGIVWPGRIPARTISEPALNIDLAPTVMSLLGLPAVAGFRGFDWTPVFQGAPAPADRDTFFQAHKGAVQTDHSSADARRAGLLEVARIDGDRKELLDLRNGSFRIYDLKSDPQELHPRTGPDLKPSDQLRTWLGVVRAGLEAASDLPVPELDAEARERLKALGYIE